MPKAGTTVPVAKPQSAPVPKTAAKVEGREVKYPVITVCGVEIPESKMRVNVGMVKEILGWEAESERVERMTKGKTPEEITAMGDNVTFGKEYDITDYYGEKVRLKNNTNNRPFDKGLAEKHAQEFVNEQWELNGETWIVGKTGLTLSMQHRGAGFVFAYQMLTEDSDAGEAHRKRWGWVKLPNGQYGPGPKGRPFEAKVLIVYGVDESPRVTQTIDKVRVRTLADSLFSNPNNFKGKGKEHRERLCKMTEVAIKTVWDRTGVKNDAFSPRKTDTEMIVFLDHHRKLIDCIEFIDTENNAGEKPEDKGAIQKLTSPGTAAALMYLTMAAGSDREAWLKSGKVVSERQLVLDWDKAVGFWGQVGRGGGEFEQVRKAIGALHNEATGQKASPPLRNAVLVNAINWYLAEEKFTAKDIKPILVKNDAGDLVLKEVPEIGFYADGDMGSDKLSGIDIGSVAKQAKIEREARKEAAEAEAARKAAEEEANGGIEGESTDDDEGEGDDDAQVLDADDKAEIERRKAKAAAAKRK